MKNRIVSVIFGGLLVMVICLVVSSCSSVKDNPTYKVTSGDTITLITEYRYCETKPSDSRVFVYCYNDLLGPELFSIIVDKFERLPDDE